MQRSDPAKPPSRLWLLVNDAKDLLTSAACSEDASLRETHRSLIDLASIKTQKEGGRPHVLVLSEELFQNSVGGFSNLVLTPLKFQRKTCREKHCRDLKKPPLLYSTRDLHFNLVPKFILESLEFLRVPFLAAPLLSQGSGFHKIRIYIGWALSVTRTHILCLKTALCHAWVSSAKEFSPSLTPSTFS